MIFISAGESTRSNDDNEGSGPEEFVPIPEEFDYYIIEITDIRNGKVTELREIINREYVSDIPDCVHWKIVRGDAKQTAIDIYGLSDYDFESPVLIITDEQPKHYTGDGALMVELGRTNERYQMYQWIQTIFRNLHDDEFNRIKWELKREKLKQSLPDPLKGAGLAASVVSVLPL